MCKFFNSIVKTFFKVWLDGIKPGWSKLRWGKYLDEEPYPVEEKITSLDEAKEVFRSVYRCFDWTMDGVDELFDTYMPVEHMYNQYRDSKKNGGLFCGDCFTGDTKIKCLDGKSYSFKELVENNVKELWVYSCTPDGNIVPAKAINPVKKTTDKQLLKITLDNGEVIKCTEDHRFMMRDGSYKMAKDIIIGKDSLMPGYFKTNEWGYLMVKNNNSRKFGYIPVHRLVGEKCKNVEMNEAIARVDKSKYEKDSIVVHHIDGDKNNNVPENLTWMTVREHNNYHMTKYNKSEKHKNSAALLGPSNGRRVLIEFNTSQRHREEVTRKNKDPEYTKLRFRGHIIKTIKKIIDNGLEINEVNYRNNKLSSFTPNFNSINKYFSSLDEAVEQAKTYNHKVIKIEKLNTTEEVYDITVPETHNFLLDAGVFVHNCDDYHSVAYHILHENGYNVASITIATNPASDSHTMVIYRDTDGCLVLVNYSVLRKYDKDKTVQDVIDDYNRIYKYKPEYYWTLHKYDYDKHEYYVLDDKENF